jgi:hypothetical protein
VSGERESSLADPHGGPAATGKQQKLEVSNTSKLDKSAAKVSSEAGSGISNRIEQQQHKSPAQVSSKS